MKIESAKRIIDAYLDIFEQMSLKSFKQGFAFVVDSYEEQVNKLKQVKTREGMEAMLLKEPEPEPVVLDAEVDRIRLLPYTIRKMMPEAMREVAKAIPHEPGGRPRSLNEDESKYVCDEIGKLIAKGVRLWPAQKRLAIRMSQKKGKDVSLRTIRRAWDDRAICNPEDVNQTSDE